jgi:hypothetical protein
MKGSVAPVALPFAFVAFSAQEIATMADDYTMQAPRAAQATGDIFAGNLAQMVETLQLPESSLPECDGLFRQLTHGEKVDRYSTVFVRFAATFAPGSDLVLAPAPDSSGTAASTTLNPTYEFFFNGLNDSSNTGGHLYSNPPVVNGTSVLPGEGCPWPLSQADTDGLKATTTNVIGANLTSDERVDFFAAAVQVKFAGLYSAVGAVPALDGSIIRQSPAFADRDAGAYIRRVLRLLFRHATLRIVREGAQFSKQTLDYRLGSIGDYPAYNEFQGSGAISAGTPVPFAFKQLPLPLLMGRAPKLVNQNRFRIFLDIDSRFAVENDSANPVPGNLSPALGGDFGDSLFVGIRLDIIGGMICIDSSGRPTRKIAGHGDVAALRAFESLSDDDKAAALRKAGIL